YRTILLASLAREAEVEAFLHRFGTEPPRQEIPAQHLPQEVRAPARGMHLFPGDAVAGAHRPLLHAAAFAHADAAQRGAREAAFVLEVAEVRVGNHGPVIRA